MSDENQENLENQTEENLTEPFFHNKLKNVDTATLQRAIAKAVGDLTGVEYHCVVNELKYGNMGSHGGTFTVEIWQNRNRW